MTFHGRAGNIAYVQAGEIYVSYAAIRAPPADEKNNVSREKRQRALEIILSDEIDHLLHMFEGPESSHNRLLDRIADSKEHLDAITDLLKIAGMKAEPWFAAALKAIRIYQKTGKPVVQPEAKWKLGDVIVVRDRPRPRVFRLYHEVEGNTGQRRRMSSFIRRQALPKLVQNVFMGQMIKPFKFL